MEDVIFKYKLNNETGEIYDIKDCRKKDYLEKYFRKYPYYERNKVKFICIDFYPGYISLAKKLFKKAEIIINNSKFEYKTLLKMRRNMSIVVYKHLDIFVGEKVVDEIVYGLESLAMKKNEIRELISSYARMFKLDELLERDPNSLGSSDKVKMKILSSMIIKPKILVIDNVISELDYEDKLLIFNILKDYSNSGGIVINFTNDIEQSMYGDKIYVIHDKKLVCEGKTLSVLNEEKLLKRLGISLPFIIDLNKYFMDYGLIKKYYLTNEKLVNALWK